MKPALKRSIYVGLAAGLLGAVGCLLQPLLELEQGLGLQALFRLRGALPPPDSVAVVAIAGASADEYGLSSDLDEWPRSLHADVIEKLDRAGAAAIVFDIIFESESDPGHDRKLAEGIARSGKVILLERVRTRQMEIEGTGAAATVDYRTEPIPAFRTAAWATAPFTLPTVPIRVAQFWTFGRDSPATANLPMVALQAQALPSYEKFIEMLAASTAQELSGIPDNRRQVQEQRGLEQLVAAIRRLFLQDPAVGARMRTALAEESLDGRARMQLEALIDAYAGPDSRYINFYGPTGTIRTIPYHTVAKADLDALASLDIEGRVVFVGFSERRQSEQQDEFVSVFSERSGLSLSGVEIGATAFANLASNSSIVPLTIPATMILIMAWSLFLALAMGSVKSSTAGLIAALAFAGYLMVARYAFQTAYLWMPLVIPVGIMLPLVLAAILLLNYRELNLQRERIQSALGRLVPAAMAQRLAQESFDPGASRELVHGTCLFSDAEHYTQVAESLSPEDLHTLVQQYFERLGACVERYGGHIADISGDSMVAIWAASKPDEALRFDACRAALQALREIDGFNANRGEQGLPTGVGLASGELSLGNISVASRYQYRAVGDIVNTAARIQGLNRQLHTKVLVSADTVASLAALRLRPIGEFLFYGKTKTVTVYELLGSAEDAVDCDLVERFSEGLRLFRQGEWLSSRATFEQLLSSYPDDGPSRFYAAQCERMVGAQRSADWTGVIRLNVK